MNKLKPYLVTAAVVVVVLFVVFKVLPVSVRTKIIGA
jgi:t-SNARE complex subunit (syntaxin)